MKYVSAAVPELLSAVINLVCEGCDVMFLLALQCLTGRLFRVTLGWQPTPLVSSGPRMPTEATGSNFLMEIMYRNWELFLVTSMGLSGTCGCQWSGLLSLAQPSSSLQRHLIRHCGTTSSIATHAHWVMTHSLRNAVLVHN